MLTNLNEDNNKKLIRPEFQLCFFDLAFYLRNCFFWEQGPTVIISFSRKYYYEFSKAKVKILNPDSSEVTFTAAGTTFMTAGDLYSKFPLFAGLPDAMKQDLTDILTAKSLAFVDLMIHMN